MQAKRNTLFSIRNKQLRKERHYSLLILRITFLFMLIPPMNFTLIARWGESVNEILFYLTNAACLYVLLWGIWRLNFWAYALFFLCRIGFEYYFYYDWDISFIEIVDLVSATLSLLPAWRVHSFLRHNEESFIEKKHTIQEEPLKKSFLSWFVDNILRKGKDTLFSIKSDVLKKNKEDFFCMRAAFILTLLQALVTASNSWSNFQNLSVQSSLVGILLGSLFYSFLLMGMRNLYFLSYAIKFSSLTLSLHYAVYEGGINKFLFVIWIVFFSAVIEAWSVHSLLLDQEEEKKSEQVATEREKNPHSAVEYAENTTEIDPDSFIK